jgi:hypothetical protein
MTTGIQDVFINLLFAGMSITESPNFQMEW